MNKKAFTLVELIAVLVLLGVLGLIAIVTVNNELRQNKETLYQIQLRNIKESAEMWAGENALRLPSNNGEFIILTLGELKQQGLSEEVVNPKTGEPFPNSLQIKITLIENNYVYEIIE